MRIRGGRLRVGRNAADTSGSNGSRGGGPVGGPSGGAPTGSHTTGGPTPGGGPPGDRPPGNDPTGNDPTWGGAAGGDTAGGDTAGPASGGRSSAGGPDSAGAGRLVSPWPRAAALLLAGALPALAFPAPGLWWFAYLALVPWLLLIRTARSPRRAVLDGWIGGIGFVIAVHHWLVPSLHVFIVLLAALLGLLWAPWGLLVSRLLGGSPSTRRAVAAVVVVPSGWLLIELVRSWEGLGGPWGLLGASQWEVSPALRVASVGGVWLVSLLVLAVNTCVALLIAAPPARRTAGVLLLLCALSVTAIWAWAPRPGYADTVRIAVVQPGIVAGPGSVARRLDRGEELTRALAGRGVDLVVWGESSIGAGVWERPETARRLTELSRRVGADLLVNVDARQTDGSGRSGIFKSAVLVGPDGPTGDRYDKMRLVPFGEYVPARSLLGWATSVGKAAGEDRLRGDRQVVMTVPDGERGLRIGPLVCFETAFPDMSRRLVRDGAQVLVAQSATSTFQGSWAPAQHASLGALRAAENGRPTVHATLTGISAAYGPRGERVGRPLGTGASAAEVFDLPLARGETLYGRFGDWPVYGAFAALAALCAVEGLRALRRPVPGPPGPPARTAHGSPGRPGR
ncbi:apolipoprotein N-acyltransferase [Streptomyces sp. NPDC059171]|uniref:apolipoprotein N-acyltransferase n=1 Tax=Streptomyces sp. NPDC059171 TaxID=3346755 RepID=UPI0036C99EDB